MTVSPYHIEAEIAAWPFWSWESFAACATELAADSPGNLGAATQRVYAGLEKHLRHRDAGFSIDMLQSTARGIWFQKSMRPSRVQTAADHGAVRPLHRVLAALACEHLCMRGEHIVLCEHADDTVGDAALRWRWLSLALCPDLLVAALFAADGVAPRPWHVSVAPQKVRYLLNQGIDQLHLHVGAAVPFDLLWTHLMRRDRSEITKENLECGGDGEIPFGNGACFRFWLLIAAIARVVLAGFLWRYALGGESRADEFFKMLPGVDSNDRFCLVRAMRALCMEREPDSAARVEGLYRRLVDTNIGANGRASGVRAIWGQSERLVDIARSDPLFAWVESTQAKYGNGADKQYASPEMWLLVHGLRYLGAAKPSAVSRRVSQIFWQYVRIRGRVFRYVVQRPGVSGLDWFSRHYNRMAGLRKGTTFSTKLDIALALEKRDANLKSLEVRTAPEKDWWENRDLGRALRDLAHGNISVASSEAALERGLVLHFIKEAQNGCKGRLHADPRQKAHGCRFGSYFHNQRIRATALVTCLQHEPQLLRWIRGIDMCSLERSVPIWVMAPLLLGVRRDADAIAGISDEPTLHVTLHVGEDYGRLISGLRQIHEPLACGVLRCDDRLGHALALGMEPQQWAVRFPVVPQTVEERLDDLLWELDCYQSGEVPADSGRIAYVSAQIVTLGRYMFGAKLNAYGACVLLNWRKYRLTPSVLQRLHYPFMGQSGYQQNSDSDVTLSLLRDYLTDFGVFVRGHRVIEVKVNESEIEACRNLQAFLRKRLATLDISVEVNPSSNLLIGDVQELDRHPVFRLQPLAATETGNNDATRVVLGDDDPITFCTCLADEYAYLYYCLLRNGKDPMHAEQWLDLIRRNGRRSRFTVPLQ